MCICVNFVKFLITPIQENICEQLPLKIGKFSLFHRFMLFEVQPLFEDSSRQMKKNIAERKPFVAVDVK